MKKRNAAMLLAALMMGSALYGCSDEEDKKGSDDKGSETTEKEESKEETKDTYAMNETAEIDGQRLTVTGVTRSAGSDFDTPKDGCEYVIVAVTIENVSDEEVSYNIFDFKVQNSNGQIDRSAFSIVDKDTGLGSGKLAPGGAVSGTIVFEEPIGDANLMLIFEPNVFKKETVKVILE